MQAVTVMIATKNPFITFEISVKRIYEVFNEMLRSSAVDMFNIILRL